MQIPVAVLRTLLLSRRISFAYLVIPLLPDIVSTPLRPHTYELLYDDIL